MNAPDTPYQTLKSCFGAFHTILVYLWPFGCVTKLGGKRAGLVQKFVARSRVKMFRNECTRSTHWTLNSCFGASRSYWVQLAMSRYYTKLGGKRVDLVQLMHKFVPWSRIGIFHNECTRSTPIGPWTHVLVRPVVLECIWRCFVTTWRSVQNGLNWCN